MIKGKRQHRLRSWALIAVTLAGIVNGITVPALAATPVVSQPSQHAKAVATGISMETYRNSSALELAAMVRSGRVTSTQLVKLAYAQIKADNPKLNGVITMRETAALKEAATLKDTGQPFLGVPILTKGLGQILEGESNTNGIFSNKDVKAQRTSTFVNSLQRNGFIVIGQTNFPELGLLNVTTSKLYGAARNAWNTDYQPGGSSGGAATSVADGMVALATGSDAGGSIRIPASWSGLIGLKPTQETILGDSQSGHGVNFAETKTMADTEALFEGLHDSKQYAGEVPSDLRTLPIGYTVESPVGTPVSADAVAAVRQAVSFLKKARISR